jgi:hypothetical protein
LGAGLSSAEVENAATTTVIAVSEAYRMGSVYANE